MKAEENIFDMTEDMNLLTNAIREKLINGRILKSVLLKDEKKWNLMCGSLDSIESAQMAINAYKEFKKDSTDRGLQVLKIYGLFQSLYVQQDSVRNLFESLDIKLKNFKKYPKLYRIRNLRNKSIGHPSKIREKNSSHSFLLNEDSLELFSYTEKGEFDYETYKISGCINIQNKEFCKIIKEAIEKINTIEQNHKGEFMSTKFRKMFPENFKNSVFLVFNAINFKEDEDSATGPQKIAIKTKVSQGSGSIEELIQSIQEFRKEFERRKLSDDFVDRILNNVDYPLKKLKDYLIHLFFLIRFTSISEKTSWQSLYCYN